MWPCLKLGLRKYNKVKVRERLRLGLINIAVAFLRGKCHVKTDTGEHCMTRDAEMGDVLQAKDYWH